MLLTWPAAFTGPIKTLNMRSRIMGGEMVTDDEIRTYLEYYRELTQQAITNLGWYDLAAKSSRLSRDRAYQDEMRRG